MLLLLLMGCSKQEELAVEGFASLQIQHYGFAARLADEDNLESEQTIHNLSIFFTEPSSEVITHKYVNAGFTTVDDYKLVTLPVSLSELGRKDIYVVTNYDNASLNAVTTLGELRGKTTPVVNKNNNFDPEKGFCMYGKTADFDFNNEERQPAIVYAVRTCAKYRVTVRFPENPTLSTDNSFLISGAANYTYIVDDAGMSIPSNAYFNFAKEIPLVADDAGAAYSNIAYVYEASQAPGIHIYTRMNNSAKTQEFTASLPLPERNYLYDIEVQIYEGQSRVSRAADALQHRVETLVKAYNENGEEVAVFL